MDSLKPRTDLCSLTPLERTRLLLGIVMIPLAVTYVFAAGAYSQRVAPESARVVEARAVFSERRMLEELPAADQGEDDPEECGQGLHWSGGLPFAAVAAVPACGALPVAHKFREGSHTPHPHPACEAPDVRGPPKEIHTC